MKICTVKNCNKEIHAKGYCPKHYYRWKLYGDPNITKSRPKGSGQIFHGYKLITVDNKQVREHRVIMEKFLGRKLKPFPDEVVHHINKNKLDNRIENLKLTSQRLHISNHFRKHFIKDNSKVCSKCKTLKPIDRFYKQKGCIDNLKSHCKDCENIYRKQRNKTIPSDHMILQADCTKG